MFGGRSTSAPRRVGHTIRSRKSLRPACPQAPPPPPPFLGPERVLSRRQRGDPAPRFVIPRRDRVTSGSRPRGCLVLPIVRQRARRQPRTTATAARFHGNSPFQSPASAIPHFPSDPVGSLTDWLTRCGVASIAVSRPADSPTGDGPVAPNCDRVNPFARGCSSRGGCRRPTLLQSLPGESFHWTQGSRWAGPGRIAAAVLPEGRIQSAVYGSEGVE